MPLSAELQRKLALANFTTPTAIQAEAIPHALAGRDVLATAQTGTGKTLAFLVPMIERLLQTTSRNPEALILVPTRELAMQVHEQYEKLRDKKLAPAALVIGGLAEKHFCHVNIGVEEDLHLPQRRSWMAWSIAA